MSSSQVSKCPHCGFQGSNKDPLFVPFQRPDPMVMVRSVIDKDGWAEVQSVEVRGCPSCLKLFVAKAPESIHEQEHRRIMEQFHVRPFK